MKILTVSRQFGSGGRELGKRVADILGFDYYDREIISAIAEKSGFAEDYVAHMSEKKPYMNIPLTYGRTLYCDPAFGGNSEKILTAQSDVIKDIAKRGRDCVIIGRGADVILSGYKPVNIFVYADMASKVKRCMERSGEGQELTEKKLIKKIKEVDSARSDFHSLISDSKWGRKESYHLCVNTTGAELKLLAPVIAVYAKIMFE
ncbi:MAG: AAA family ATPase [Porcipelethomonas sp.]